MFYLGPFKSRNTKRERWVEERRDIEKNGERVVCEG